MLRLVDCSLLVPPRAGPDGRSRYGMLETLRGFGAGLLAEAGEQDGGRGRAGRVRGAGGRAGCGGPDDQHRGGGRGPVAGCRGRHHAGQVLAWALDHDPAMALRLAVALGWWWLLRGRLAGQYLLLREVAGRAEPGSDGWCAAQLWLGMASLFSADHAGVAGLLHRGPRCLAGPGAVPRCWPTPWLAGRSILLNLGRTGEAAEDGRRALAMARELGYPAGEAAGPGGVGLAAYDRGDYDEAVRLAWRQQQITAAVPGGQPGSAAPGG